MTTHRLVNYLATTTYLCWLCHSPLPDKGDYFVCLLIMTFSLAIPHGMHLVVPTHLSSFGWIVIPAGRFLQKSLSENPRTGFPFSPPLDYTFSYLWPTTPVLVGYRSIVPGLCICSTSCVCQKLVHCSCICHGLEAHLCILLLILDFLRHELSFDFPFFIGFLLSRIGPCLIVGFPFLSPYFVPFIVLLPFLSYHSAISIVVLFDPCLLGLSRAYYVFFLPLVTMSQFSHWAYTHAAFGLYWPITFLIGSFGPFLGHS